MVNFAQALNFFLSQVSPFQISIYIKVNPSNSGTLKPTKPSAGSYSAFSNKKDKSFLISLFYLVLSSLVVSTINLIHLHPIVSTIRVSSSMHTAVFITNSCLLTQSGLITTGQLNPNNLSTFDNLRSYRRILINSINFDNLQSGKDILILSILLVEHFQFISSGLFIIKSCSLLISLQVGLNHFPFSSPVLSGHVSSALPIRYTRFEQNRSILSCRVLFSRITSRLPIDSSKINSFSPTDSCPTHSDPKTQAFQIPSPLVA